MKGTKDGFCSPTHLFLRISHCLDVKGAKDEYFSPIFMVRMSHCPEVKGTKDGFYASTAFFLRMHVMGAKESKNDLLRVIFCGCVTARGGRCKRRILWPKSDIFCVRATAQQSKVRKVAMKGP